jgi:transcriptional regulator with XRE-family HTH domain
MGLVEIVTVEEVSTPEERARARLKVWLRAMNMTQTELGERIGKNQAWMSRYFAGKLQADFTTLEAMAGVFGHTLNALIDLPRDPAEARLIEIYRAMPARSRLAFLDYLATVVYPDAAGRPRRPPKP